MGLVREWFAEREAWTDRMSGGTPGAFLGSPSQSQGRGTGVRGAGDGGWSGPMTERERQKLIVLFQRENGRFPRSEYEFLRWVVEQR